MLYMARLKLKAEKREILGRKVKNLRQKNIIPGNLYGRDIKSQALQLDLKSFLSVFNKTGETGLIDLKIGQLKAKTVLASDIQLDPITDIPLHVNFRQIDLTKKTIVAVPIEIIGKAPAVEKGNGILIQTLQEIEVEALPEDLPDHINIDVSNLEEINDAVRVKELKVNKKITLKANENEVVAKIEAPIAKEEVAEASTSEEEIITEEGAEKETEEKAGEKKAGKEKVKKPKEKQEKTTEKKK